MAESDSDTRAELRFSAFGYRVRFRPPTPWPAEDRAAKAMTRAFQLTIKKKIGLVERGVESFEEAFLAHIVQQDGRTIGEAFIPTWPSSNLH